jgi:hypothetical protein
VTDDHGFFWTDDSGGSWENVTPPGVSPTAVSGATFLPDGHGWAAQGTLDAFTDHSVAHITVFQRASGSSTWSSSTIADVPVVNWLGRASLSFLDPARGWLLIDTGSHAGFNYAVLYRTADGGVTWTRLDAPASGGLEFLSSTTGYIAGGEIGPNLFVTHDGGATWSQAELPPPGDRGNDKATVLGVPAIDAGVAVVAASWTDPRGNPDGFGTYRSTNSGRTWQLLDHESGPTAYYVWSSGPTGRKQVLLRSGPGLAESVAQSVDGGRTFSAFSPAAGLPATPRAVSAGDGDTVWTVVQVNGCRSPKSDCFQSSGLFSSSDGGGTWRQLTLP